MIIKVSNLSFVIMLLAMIVAVDITFADEFSRKQFESDLRSSDLKIKYDAIRALLSEIRNKTKHADVSGSILLQSYDLLVNGETGAENEVLISAWHCRDNVDIKNFIYRYYTDFKSQKLLIKKNSKKHMSIIHALGACEEPKYAESLWADFLEAPDFDFDSEMRHNPYDAARRIQGTLAVAIILSNNEETTEKMFNELINGDLQGRRISAWGFAHSHNPEHIKLLKKALAKEKNKQVSQDIRMALSHHAQTLIGLSEEELIHIKPRSHDLLSVALVNLAKDESFSDKIRNEASLASEQFMKKIRQKEKEK